MDKYWETYQRTQRFEDMLKWLKHSAWLRIEAEKKTLQPVRITVYNYKEEFYLPGKLTVDAFCVGGVVDIEKLERAGWTWNGAERDNEEV